MSTAYTGKSIRMAYNPSLVVMVVEDHLLFRRDIMHALPDHRIVPARTVEEARQCYDDNLPDLTFLDIDLPDGTGFDVLDYIREREPDAYVVMLTGSKAESDVLVSQKKGARSYVIKPFTRSKVEQQVGRYMEYREWKIKSLVSTTQAHRNEELALMPHMKIT